VGHFEHRALAELAVTFERYIGAKFSLKWFRLSNQSRKKGRKRMVTESTKMTLLNVGTKFGVKKLDSSGCHNNGEEIMIVCRTT